MEIVEVSDMEYSSIMSNPYHAYGSAGFNSLNSAKCESLHFLLFREGKFRLGIVGGIREHGFHSPFSAPFGGFMFLLPDIKLQFIEEATELLTTWSVQNSLDNINITLPPPFYQTSYISKLTNVLYRKGFTEEKIELNYHFITAKLSHEYADLIWRNARKNLHISMASNLSFETCESSEKRKTAYNIIKLNRDIKGKPLRLSFEELEETSKVIPSNYFLVKDPDSKYIASAIVFLVAKEIAQVIYWGDNPKFAHLKTMNFLSYHIFDYYKNQKYSIVDLGYSTVDSIPNYGLCEFKESLGCEINTKVTLKKKL